MSDENELEQGFNESELQDIMNEIEDLEDEFVSDQKVENTEDLKLEVCKPNDMQSSIDHEVDSFLDNKEMSEQELTDSLIDDLDAELNGDHSETDNIDNQIEDGFEEATKMSEAQEDDTEAELAALANIEILEPSSSDEIEEEVQVMESPVQNIRPISNTVKSNSINSLFNMNFMIGANNVSLEYHDGLSLEVSGVKVTITEDSGCSVELPGGIKFNIPLTNDADKKAA